MVNINIFKKIKRASVNQLLGIELEKNRLKLTYLDNTITHQRVLNLTQKDISGLDEKEISKLVLQSISGFNLNKPQIVSIINPSSVITKNIEIPSIDPQEIKEIISLQASRHTPYSREEILVDHINLGVYRRNYSRILLVIVNRGTIKKHLDVLGRIGLEPTKIVFSAEAIALSVSRLFNLNTENAFGGIIHIDEDGTDFMIIFSSKPIFIRHIPVGAKQLVFEKEKYQTRFLEEIRRSQELYLSEDIGKMPNVFILTGGIETIGSIENELDITVQKVSYFKELSISEEVLKNISFNKNVSFLNTVACLISLDKIKIDLIPDELRLKRLLQVRARQLFKSGILILTSFVILFFILLSKIYFKSIYLKKLDEKYKLLMEEAKKIEEDFELLSLAKNYLAKRGYPLEVLAELYNLLPQEIEISDIRYDEQGKFSLKGSASAMSVVFTLVDNLEKSEYFKEVKTRYTTKRKIGTKDVTDFEIVCGLEKSS